MKLTILALIGQPICYNKYSYLFTKVSDPARSLRGSVIRIADEVRCREKEIRNGTSY